MVEHWRNRIVGQGTEAPEQLLANPQNWRVHPKHQQDALSGALNELGWIQQIVVNQQTGHVVDGHLRVSLAISRREASVPVLYVDLTPEEEALALLTLDPIASMAAADKEQLDALLRDVQTGDAGLQAMLADLAEREGLAYGGEEVAEDPGAQVDRAEELREKWQTASGQIWECGKHRLMCGDSTSAEDVARLMGGEKAVLMATDPPYLVDYQGGNHPQSWANKADVKDKHWDDYHEADGPTFFIRYLKTALEVALVGNPAIYQWHAALRQKLVQEAWEAVGLLLHQQIIWVKARPVLTRSHYMWQHEPCFYGWVKGKQPARKPPANAKTVWEVNQQGESDGIHPTQKPTELSKRPMEYHTEPGELCYEPFSGSGTCLVAAEQTGRRCYALEIAPEFVAVALERMAGMGLEPRLTDG